MSQREPIGRDIFYQKLVAGDNVVIREEDEKGRVYLNKGTLLRRVPYIRPILVVRRPVIVAGRTPPCHVETNLSSCQVLKGTWLVAQRA